MINYTRDTTKGSTHKYSLIVGIRAVLCHLLGPVAYFFALNHYDNRPETTNLLYSLAWVVLIVGE